LRSQLGRLTALSRTVDALMSAPARLHSLPSAEPKGATDYLVDEIVSRVLEGLRPKLEGPRARRLLTAEQAAEYLGFTENAVRHMIADGTLPIVRVGERGIRFDLDDLDAFIKERKK